MFLGRLWFKPVFDHDSLDPIAKGCWAKIFAMSLSVFQVMSYWVGLLGAGQSLYDQ